MRKFLITGGSGFIGSRIALRLQELYPKAYILVVDNFSSGYFKTLYGFKGDVIEGAIEDKDLWEYLKKEYASFEAVFHNGAITDTTILDQKFMMDVNTNSMKYIIDACIKWDAKLIYASSAGVYGNTEAPMREDRGLIPENVYGFSKLMADNLVKNKMEEYPSFRAVGFRYFNVYGMGEQYKGKTASMIYQLAMQMKSGKNPRLFKYGEQKRDFVYIEDVLQANIKALERYDASGIFNVGYGKARSFNDIVEILNHLMGANYEIEYFDCPYEFYQNYTEADISAIKEKLGYEPKYDLESGIEHYLKSLKLI
ncbi:ADP-L-glycero-D-manno-heptose-6-epimerase [Hydrogenobaculum sp. Y04AAS1]|uniref:ADP-glyceromanno-heptose 6-epimerase n=1 Tax=Hydrogenobaculum sp. (strain Y04AAS1) TaxID=380749 RepID=UPI00015BD04D|nr:ADP-L-glycero-D-manno-heptose-6-epimerase [Hydrogenobaculum sp. Y04AAS1]HCT66696.1 ADP-glyceromanno-heptose 6-epimerase [Hydrogenobaculum sp.]